MTEADREREPVLDETMAWSSSTFCLLRRMQFTVELVARGNAKADSVSAKLVEIDRRLDAIERGLVALKTGEPSQRPARGR